ncbi:MAG: 4,5-DOPA dioxygenase extradiol [Burkholderiales bacterium]
MSSNSARMPLVFFGHGSPMLALDDGAFPRAWRAIARAMAPPQAILMISAHWCTAGLAVTAQDRPATIHDFQGFPAELYALDYPAPGCADLARRVRAMLAPLPVAMDEAWGLDHGTWCVLRHAYPAADVPVVQLSLDLNQPAGHHLEVGRRLRELRETGVLIAGSGNVVHNLRAMRKGSNVPAYPWATRFESKVRAALVAGDEAALLHLVDDDADARLANPSPEHLLPLLVIAGARHHAEPVTFPVSGIDMGSISMLSCIWGGAA